METPLHKVFLQNGQIRLLSDFSIPHARLSVYEVIRLMGRVPLFLEDHLERWRRSAELMGEKMAFAPGRLLISIHQLVNVNEVADGNIKLIYNWKKDETKGDCYAWFIPHRYPTDEENLQGIGVGLLHAERENPTAKVDHTRVRNQADAMIHAKGVYEVLLVDRNGYITEGSRSNCFMIRKGELLTPPSQAVLSGITRQKVLALCEELGFAVKEELVHEDDLDSVEALFLTGTSPGVLPIARIDQRSFQIEHPIIHSIREVYQKMVEDYILNFERNQI